MKKRRVVIAGLVLAVLSVGAVLLASSPVSPHPQKQPADALDQLREETEYLLTLPRTNLVVLGRVVEQEVRDDDTFSTILVDRVLKGGAQRDVVIKTHGVEAGSGPMFSEGDASFARGEQVLVFLRNSGRGFFDVVDGDFGKFSIQPEPATGRLILIRPSGYLYTAFDSPLVLGDPESDQHGEQRLRVYLDDYLNLVDALTSETASPRKEN